LTILLHQLWELFEASSHGISFMRKHGFPDYNGDTATNSAADTLWALTGSVLLYNIYRIFVRD